MKAAIRWGVWAVAAILATASPLIARDGLRWESDLQSAQKLARQTDRLVLIHFGGPWCGPCQMLEQRVFSQPGFGRELNADYVAVKVDPHIAPEIARNYGIDRVPTDVVTTPSGQLIYRIASPDTAGRYVDTLAKAAAAARPQRQEAPPQTEPASPSPPQVASNSRYGAPAAAAPADQRYADYHNRQQAVEREPYQPPVQSSADQAGPVQNRAVQNGPVQNSADRYAAQTTTQASLTQTQAPAGPAAQPAAPAVDRDADRYAARSAESAPQQNSRYPMNPADRYATHSPQPEQADAERTQAGDNPADRYAGYSSGQASRNTSPSPSQQPPVNPVAASDPDSLAAKVPPGSPPLAYDGYSSVTLVEQRKWEAGDPKFGAIHRGMLYLFTSQAEQQKFLAEPDRYAPMVRGYDPVLALDQNKAVPGSREFGVYCEGRIYLFSSADTRDHFEHNTKRYSADILQAMRQSR
jgi:thiol-disulfide isomerase/thioredoxin/YHS domain-containing protein